MDPGGLVWAGAFGGGLYCYDKGAFRRWTTADGLSTNHIWSILPEADGHVWLGTLSGGLQTFDPATGKFSDIKGTSEIPLDYVLSMVRGRDGLIYAGTVCGIAVINPVDLSVSKITGSTREKQEFSNLNINQIAYDSRGLLWVGTREGLQVYDKDTDTLYPVKLSDRIPNPFILGVIEGADRSMWVTVSKNLYNISVDYDNEQGTYSFRVKSLGSHGQGTFNQRSMCLLPSGEILAGSIDGVVSINPDKILGTPFYPRVIFTGISVKNVPIQVGKEYRGRVLLPEAPEYTESIKLSHDQNDITVYFATDNFSNSGHTVYRYRLQGHDKDWIYCMPGTHHASYTNLAPGTYKLEVSARTLDGFESKELRTLTIEVAAPWWATVWAKILYAVLFIALSIWGVRFYQRRTMERLKEQQQREIAEKTEELNQMKFKFFTNISHELRTPLTLILSPVESMLKENPDERNLRRLNTVKVNASRLLYLVNQLLDFRKNEMAGLSLHLSEGDVVTSIRQACNAFEDLTGRRDITFDLRLPDGKFDMSYDNDKLTKILLNLLSNAVKYTPNGGHITVSMTPGEDSVAISVADTGKGISAKDKVHIFERFYRSDDSSDLSTGTGIGLSLVYEYARLHGGKVDVSDNEPCGTIFTVTIPIRHVEQEGAPEEAKSAETAVEPSAPQAAPQDMKPRVLFVDDNADLAAFLCDEFGDAYSVDSAANGAEALEKIASGEHYDLIVTDLMMPEMDGIELTRRLKSDPLTAGIPLIMLTAKQDMDTIIEGLTLGADDYITKPFNNEVLALKINHLIGLTTPEASRDSTTTAGQEPHAGKAPALIDPEPSRIEITSRDEQLIDKAVKYVEENMGRSDLSVEELAQAMGMSRVHLYKKIIALTGKSPIEFIRRIRLKRSCQYLTESQLSISEIAYKLGFNTPRYFSAYFKDEFGMTPREYQAKSQQQ